MANVVPTSDGKWLLTYEYWGGGDNVRYKVADRPAELLLRRRRRPAPASASLPVDGRLARAVAGRQPGR